jgi:hypothetical protein
MNNLEKLHLYMVEAIRRTTAKEYRKVSAALIPVLPDLVTALKQVITDNQTTPAQRLQAAGMLQALWARCLRDEDRKQKQLTKRARIKATKPPLDAEVQEQFLTRLRNISDEDADDLFAKLQRAYDRRKTKNGGVDDAVDSMLLEAKNKYKQNLRDIIKGKPCDWMTPAQAQADLDDLEDREKRKR